MNNNLTSYESWQLDRFGSYIPEGSIDDSEVNEEFIQEPIIETEINGDDDFNFHPDWCY